jgi:hypothetical protein
LHGESIIDVVAFRDIGALAHDLSNRIIDIHHGVHTQKLSPARNWGKQQGSH